MTRPVLLLAGLALLALFFVAAPARAPAAGSGAQPAVPVLSWAGSVPAAQDPLRAAGTDLDAADIDEPAGWPNRPVSAAIAPFLRLAMARPAADAAAPANTLAPPKRPPRHV